MFDLGFTEILIIGVVALVVLGPERLPEVARTAGRLMAKAQGYIAQMKGEFDRQTQLSDVMKLRQEFASQAASLKGSLTQVQTTLEKDAQAIKGSLKDVAKSGEESSSAIADEAERSYTQFNLSKETLQGGTSRRTQASSFRTNNPFGWNMGGDDDASFQSQYIPKRYKPTASLDDVIAELEDLRGQLALPRKAMGGYNRRYAPRARVNRVRIYR